MLDSLVLNVRKQVFIELFERGAFRSSQAQLGYAARDDIVCFRTDPLDVAEDNFERGWKDRQTRNDDAQYRFQGRHDANPCDAISVIIHSKLAS